MRIVLLCTAALVAQTLPAAAQVKPGEPPISAQTQVSGGVRLAEQTALDFRSADLSIEVFPDRQRISGHATLGFTAKQAVDKIILDLDSNFRVTRVAVNRAPLDPARVRRPDGRIEVLRSLRPGEVATVEIFYEGTPHVAVRAPWDGGFVWGKTKDGRPWIATAVEGEGCDLFWPCLDFPAGEPLTMDVHITVPKGLKAPSNGRFMGMTTLADGRTTWNWRAKSPNTYAIALNIAPYEVVEGDYRSRFGNTIPMRYWYLPGEQAQAEGLFAEFAPTLDFFESEIGPYPFGDEKLGVVETPHLGMEHQTINAYGNGYKKAPEGFDWLFQHEFSHEWFGNQLTAANWDDYWLHEGYGAYMQPLYGLWREGYGRYIAMMMKQRETIANRAPIVSGKIRTEEQVYEEDKGGPAGDIYVKGSWVLHTLRNLIGDKAFFDVTRLAVYGRTDPRPGNFKPRYGSTAEYRKFVNQVTGADYGWFFDVYLSEAALPELVETRQGTTLTLQWKAPGNKPFPMPVEVDVDGKVTRLAMTGGRDTLSVPEGAHVTIDPMARILKRNSAIEAVQAQTAAARRK